MGYGLTTYNPSGQLTLSSDGYTYGYIGQASLVSVTQAGTGSTSASSGRSTYTIDWPGKIIVALPIKDNGGTTLLGMLQSGSTWTVYVHKASGSVDSRGFDIQESTEVFVFGAPVSASGYGMAFYNAAGDLALDFGRRPLMFDRFVEIAADDFSYSFSGLTTPAIIGSESATARTSTFSSPFWLIRNYRGSWRMNTALGRVDRVLHVYSYSRDSGSLGSFTTRPAISAVLIEAP